MKFAKTKIIRSILTVVLLLPLVSFILFTFTGIFVNHNNYYFVCNILLLLFFFATFTKMRKNTLRFFFIVFLILAFNLYFYINNNGTETGIIEFLRTFTRYYFFIFLGYVFYNYYYQKGKETTLLRLVVYFALFIAFINICQFILLQTDNYSIKGWTMTFNRYNIMVRYLEKLNYLFNNYLIVGYWYDGIFRPAGYFFDTHSQYFLPLGALIILSFKDIGFKYKKLIIGFLFLSILFSGIKTAYITIILLGIIFLMIHFNNKRIIRYIGVTFLLIIILSVIFNKYIISLFFGENLWGIFFQLLDHLVQIPVKLWNFDKMSFLFGGAPFLREEDLFYSEIFLISVTFFIGFVGLLLYFCPIILLKKIKSDKLPAFIYLSFLLSLSHYSVFLVGINYLLPALSFMYFFILIEKQKPILPSIVI